MEFRVAFLGSTIEIRQRWRYFFHWTIAVFWALTIKTEELQELWIWQKLIKRLSIKCSADLPQGTYRHCWWAYHASGAACQTPATATDALLQRRSKLKHKDFFIIHSVNRILLCRKVSGGCTRGSELLALPLSLLSVVVPTIRYLFFCKILHNVAIFAAISPGCCNLGNHSFRSLFSHVLYKSHTHRLQ